MNYDSNDEIEFFRCEDENGFFIGMRKIYKENYDKTDDEIAVQVLTELGCEIPLPLKNKVSSVKVDTNISTDDSEVEDNFEYDNTYNNNFDNANNYADNQF